MSRYPNSQAWLERAKPILPCVSQTLSKAPSRFPAEHPYYITRGEGSRIWDADGHAYIDYVLSLGPVILGHGHPEVTEAVVEQVKKGFVYSLSSPLEIIVAEKLIEMIPCAEAVRFVKSGSEAVNACVRLARTYTGRELVAVEKASYHGALDWFQVVEELGKHGIPVNVRENIVQFERGNVDDLKRAVEETGKPLAAVVLEPGRDFEQPVDFLLAVKNYCAKAGAIYIYDEVVTGFRFANGGAQERIGVLPDIAAFGKAMANGAPISAIVGRRDIMDAFNRCFVSGTYGGEAVSLAAALATMMVIQRESVTEHCWRQGAKLRQAFDGIMASLGLPGKAKGIDVCSRQTFDGEHAKELAVLWMEETAKRGLLFGAIQYMSYAHSDKDLDLTIEQMGFAAEALRQAMQNFAQPFSEEKATARTRK